MVLFIQTKGLKVLKDCIRIHQWHQQITIFIGETTKPHCRSKQSSDTLPRHTLYMRCICPLLKMFWYLGNVLKLLNLSGRCPSKNIVWIVRHTFKSWKVSWALQQVFLSRVGPYAGNNLYNLWISSNNHDNSSHGVSLFKETTCTFCF